MCEDVCVCVCVCVCLASSVALTCTLETIKYFADKNNYKCNNNNNKVNIQVY